MAHTISGVAGLLGSGLVHRGIAHQRVQPPPAALERVHKLAHAVQGRQIQVHHREAAGGEALLLGRRHRLGVVAARLQGQAGSGSVRHVRRTARQLFVVDAGKSSVHLPGQTQSDKVKQGASSRYRLGAVPANVRQGWALRVRRLLINAKIPRWWESTIQVR